MKNSTWLQVPGDKAIAHRALLLAVLARGDTVLHGVPGGDDVAATRRLVEQLGVRVVANGRTLQLTGPAPARTHADPLVLDCRASGTTLRLATGLLAGRPGTYVLTVSPQLARRPMAHVLAPLRAMGAQIEELAPAAGIAATDTVPRLRITGGTLQGLDYRALYSSGQLKSAFILAALQAQGPSRFWEPSPSRDHLERLLPSFCSPSPLMGEGPAGSIAVVPQLLHGAAVPIPGDISSAAPWILAGVLGCERALIIDGVGLNPTRLGFVRTLQRMGARIVVQQTSATCEPVGRITAFPGALRSVHVAAHEVPTLIDELPLLCLAAACADGVSVLHGVGALRSKESDRLQVTLELLRRLHVKHWLSADDRLTIAGNAAQWLPATPRRVRFPATADHRMVMLASLVGLVTAGAVQVNIPDPEAVAKSYPGYWADWRQVFNRSILLP